MVYEEEASFTKDLLAKRRRSTGNMWGWRLEDVPLVVEECRKHNFAILGCNTKFFFPTGTCELYWLNADPKERLSAETWAQYVDRSCSEFAEMFNELVENTNFEQEGIDGFDFIRRKKDSGTNILDYLCFEISVISENHYLKLKRK
jgi:hypothetical protein